MTGHVCATSSGCGGVTGSRAAFAGRSRRLVADGRRAAPYGIAELSAQEWAALEGGRSPLWSHEAFALMERTPIGVDDFAYVAVRRGGRLAAVLPAFWLCGFALDDVVGSGAQRLARRVRRAWPGFARVSVLVCRHPLAEGRLLGDRLSADEAGRQCSGPCQESQGSVY